MIRWNSCGSIPAFHIELNPTKKTAFDEAGGLSRLGPSRSLLISLVARGPRRSKMALEAVGRLSTGRKTE